MSGTLVAVGIGNSSIKIGISPHAPAGRPQWSDLIEIEMQGFSPRQLAGRLPSGAARWRVASVQRTGERRLYDWIVRSRPLADYRLLSFQDLPLVVDEKMKHPDRVGMDRLVAAVAANALRDPRRPAIVVDAGTAITVDLVSERGTFLGGVILPGFHVVARALATSTDLLPEVNAAFDVEPPPLIGKSTEEAIRSGLFWGNVGAVRELVARVADQLAASPQVFLTGGDAQKLTSFIDDAQFVSDLVLLGIALSSKTS